MLRLIFFEACALHPALRFLIPHERVPDETGAYIFCHQHGDSSINSNYVAVVPIPHGVECIYKSILTPRPRIVVLDVPEHPHHRLGQEWKGTCGSAWDDGSIDGPHHGRASPN